MSNYLQKILISVSALILLALVIFFSQDLRKNYYFAKLGSLNITLKEVMKQKSLSERNYIIKNALPVLNQTKINFLKYIGYWPGIFNGYNQAAFIEYLNNDKKTAVKLLLRSIHFHPNLAETYRALSIYLGKAGWQKGARKCRMYHNGLIEGHGIHPEDQKACLECALKFCTD